MPLTVQDRVIGMMSMSRVVPDYFTPRHVALARAIADQAAVAIENARLYEQAQVLIKQDAPWVPLFHSTQMMATRKGVDGFFLHPVGEKRFNTITWTK